jgi:hypothetical protein
MFCHYLSAIKWNIGIIISMAHIEIFAILMYFFPVKLFCGDGFIERIKLWKLEKLEKSCCKITSLYWSIKSL